ncbi:MAG TPA: SUF system Fe-S cluster assembly regulator [Povalibacter sp.]|nr:SUF system Fe-S cluster assembly regulator [Povalibacter sp.]
MLRISKLTDYGTVILAHLASQPERSLAAAEVAERTHIALPTVSKLLKTLQRAGLVSSTRGSLGGYQLARPASEITAAKILDALEGPFAITECSGQHSNCGIESNCQVGHVWQRVNGAIRRALNDVTLAQLAGIERGTSTTIPLTRISRVTHE